MSEHPESKLRERCAEILVKNQNVMFPDELYAFVMSEIGRAADERFDDSSPLVLFFTTPADRQELVDAIKTEKPNMLSKHWP